MGECIPHERVGGCGGDRGSERLGTPSWRHAEVTNSERERTYQSTISSVIKNTKKNVIDVESRRIPRTRNPTPHISWYPRVFLGGFSRTEPVSGRNSNHGPGRKFELLANFGAGKSKLGVPGHIYPEIKGQWLNLHFFLKTANGEIYIFFDLSFSS